MKLSEKPQHLLNKKGNHSQAIYSETSIHSAHKRHHPMTIIHFLWSQKILNINKSQLHQTHHSLDCCFAILTLQ